MRAVNLIPSEQRSGGTVGARSGGAVFLVLGLLAGMAVLALLYGSAHHQLQSRHAEASTLDARAQQVQAQAAQLAPYASFMAIREQRLSSIAQLIGGGTKTAPATGSGAVSSATPPGATPTLTLAGCATSQTVVAQMLVRLRLVSGVSSVSLQSSTKPGGSGSNGPCPANGPVFTVAVDFEPLPSTPAPSVQALISPASASGAKRTAAAVSTGGSR
jgi:hypothetical protein